MRSIDVSALLVTDSPRRFETETETRDASDERANLTPPCAHFSRPGAKREARREGAREREGGSSYISDIHRTGRDFIRPFRVIKCFSSRVDYPLRDSSIGRLSLDRASGE